jgi:hypothetical protein
MMETIVALHRNHLGEIISLITSEGRVISYRKALMEVENGQIQGLHLLEEADGTISLIPDSNKSFDHFPNLF